MTKDELIEQLEKAMELPRSRIPDRIIQWLDNYIGDSEIHKKLWELNYRYNNMPTE